MDKTHNISLGGLAFHIDDAAFYDLSNYLNDIKRSVGNGAEAEEIVSDVEYRMAELLRERMMAREVVNLQDVQYLKSVMGEPRDFSTNEYADEQEYFSSSANRSFQNKKLYRDPDDKVLGGVCSGIGHYFAIDRTWVRLFVVLLPFLDVVFLGISTGFVILMYFVLWLVVPEAKTTSEKLQMRGEPVNVDSIKDFFGKSPENVRSNIQDVSQDARRAAQGTTSAVGQVFKIILKVFAGIGLFILFMIALSLVFAFIAAIVGIGGTMFGLSIASFSLGEYAPYIFDGFWEKPVAYLSLFLVMVIPAIALILAILRIISKRYRVPRIVGFGLPFLWLAGLIGLAAVVGLTLRNFQRTADESKIVSIPSNDSTLVIQKDEAKTNYDLDDLFRMREGYLAFPTINDNIEVRKSDSDKAYLELFYKAKGIDRDAAKKAINDMVYNYQISDSLVRLDQFIYVKEGNKWRNQTVKPILYLPEGKKVKFYNFDDGISHLNGHNTYFDTDEERTYAFVGNEFKCISCFGELNNLDKSNVEESEKVEDSLNINNDTIQKNDSTIK